MHSSHSESDLSDDGFRQMSLVNQMQSFAYVTEL
jgi:hypothetical protein